MQDQTSAPRLRLVAHRGWSKRFPENSLIAFAAAIAAKADEIELDAWCSKDDIPFVCHDPNIDRVSNLKGRCDNHTMTELRNAEIKLPDGSCLPGVGFVSLEEALDFCAGRVAVNLHLKETGPSDRILHVLRDYFSGKRPPCGSYIAGGSDVLAAALKICPEIPRCCLEGQHDGAVLLQNALKFKCERLQFMRGNFTQDDIDNALEAKLITNLFWSDDANEIVELFQRGILAPLTNDIGQVRANLKRMNLV